MAARTAQAAVLFLLLPLAALWSAQALERRLPVVDEMPPVPAGASATSPAGDVVTFYPRVPSALAAGPDLSRYGIECSVPIQGEGYFTLARSEDGKAALFILTAQAVTDLTKVVSFGDPKKSMDWGFLYDRNGDGWVDYIAFLLGAMPVETPEIVAKVPKRPTPQVDAEGQFKLKMSREEFDLSSRTVRLVFIHHADDDFDGKVDAIVSALRDPDRYAWIYRRAVLRSRSHTQGTDEDWVFEQDITHREGPIPRAADGRLVRLEGLGNVRENHLEEFSVLFQLTNEGLRNCRIPKGALPRE
jgi:hypothetical protein